MSTLRGGGTAWAQQVGKHCTGRPPCAARSFVSSRGIDRAATGRVGSAGPSTPRTDTDIVPPVAMLCVAEGRPGPESAGLGWRDAAEPPLVDAQPATRMMLASAAAERLRIVTLIWTQMPPPLVPTGELLGLGSQPTGEYVSPWIPSTPAVWRCPAAFGRRLKLARTRPLRASEMGPVSPPHHGRHVHVIPRLPTGLPEERNRTSQPRGNWDLLRWQSPVALAEMISAPTRNIADSARA